MARFAINGKFVGERVTGMQRFAIEVLRELDIICEPGELTLVIPKDVTSIPQYSNIAVAREGKKGLSPKLGGLLWEQTAFPRYLKRNSLLGINMLAIVPVLMPHGITVAHGVNYKVNPSFFKSPHDKLSRVFHLFNWHFLYKYADTIIAVSEFSKTEMTKAYDIDASRIVVAGNGWQHMDDIEAAQDTFDRYNAISPGNYYFSMSSVNENKNFKWIVAAAAANPKDQFAIAGGRSLQEYFDRNGIVKPDNLTFLGYVSDADAKTLMQNCKAFLFPTFYEGFGIPPMEAMACGAVAIVSDTPTMHEVYGGSVHYINPHDGNVNLDELLQHRLEPPEKALSKYSWKKTAEVIYKLIVGEKCEA